MTGAVKLNTAGGGSVVVQPASNIASDVTVNVPSQNCTLGIQGPAFSAFASAATTISANTWTKVTIDVEEFDTNNNFASSRFTPTVAGYYQISGAVAMSTGGTLITSIYKNGVEFKRLGYSTSGVTVGGSYIVYFNGTTDYVELYVYSSNTIVNGTSLLTYFGGAMVRSA